MAPLVLSMMEAPAKSIITNATGRPMTMASTPTTIFVHLRFMSGRNSRFDHGGCTLGGSFNQGRSLRKQRSLHFKRDHLVGLRQGLQAVNRDDPFLGRLCLFL